MTVQVVVLFPAVTLTLYSFKKSDIVKSWAVVNANLISFPFLINLGEVENASPFTENDAPAPTTETFIL